MEFSNWQETGACLANREQAEGETVAAEAASVADGEEEPHGPQLTALQAVSETLLQSLATDNPALSRSMRIHVMEEAIKFISDGEQRAKMLESLARELYAHSQALNEWQALERSLEHLEEALEITEIKVDYARLAVFYSECLARRYVRSRNPEDLDNAEEYAKKSTDLIHELADCAEKLALLISAVLNHWFCVFLKLELGESSADSSHGDHDGFDLLMDLAFQADRLVTDNHIEGDRLAAAKTNLGKSYEMRWELSGRAAESFDDLSRGLGLAREAAALSIAQDASDRVSALSNLAHRLQKAYLAFVVHGLLPTGVSGGHRLLDESLELLSETITLPTENLLDGSSNVMAFVIYIRQFPVDHRAPMLGRCETLLRASVATLQELWPAMSVNDRHDAAATFYGTSRYAAASVMQNNGDTVDALLLFEAGRGFGLASRGQELQDNSFIATVHPQLSQRYQDATKALRDALQNVASYHERRERLRELDELRLEMDSVPGIARPPALLTREELLSLGHRSDIVVINITDIRSDAIVISKGEIFAVSLPGINEEDLSEKSWEIQTRLATELDQEVVFPELHRALLDLFALLWKRLAVPVLDRLTYQKPVPPSERWPHVCWIPSGILCLYPLHAAGLGLHREANVINRVVSSYASSLTSLRNIRRSRPDRSPLGPKAADLEICVISTPETPGMQPLELSVQEVEAVKASFRNTTILTGRPTQDVLSAMAAEPAVLHFSCHGEVDYDHPLQSKLLSVDWQTDPLTVDRIQLLHLKKPMLAYLSACFTANAGVENQQDEGVHLAGALQIAGLPNVVGSAWYVGEGASLDVVRRFYRRLSSSLTAGLVDWACAVEEALHFAVMEVAESTRTAANRGRGDPVLWAPFMVFSA